MKTPFIIAASLIIVAALASGAPLPFAAQGFEVPGRVGVELAAVGAEAWDFSGVGEVRVAVSNASDRAARVRVAVFGEGMSLDASPKAPCRMSRIPPHAVRTIAIPLNDTPYATDATVALTGMQGKVPAVDALPDFSKTGRIEIFADATERVPPASGGRFVETPLPGSVSGRDTPTACPLAGGSPAEFVVLGVETAFVARRPKVIPADSFFPFVDRYGQFRHDDWPVAAFDEQERGRLFRQYAGKCLDNPRYVGCHWFQYQDQPLTGRFDGENFACGFVSICDVPYPELVEACQETAAAMYSRRIGRRKD